MSNPRSFYHTECRFGFIFLFVALVTGSSFGQQKKYLISHKNLLKNPGAEQSEGNFPPGWITTTPNANGENWVSLYGRTAREWEFDCGPKCGLPQGAGRNYFRLQPMASDLDPGTLVNLAQVVEVAGLPDSLATRPYQVHFRSWVAASPPIGDCGKLELILQCLGQDDAVLAEKTSAKVLSQFKDLDAQVDDENPYGGKMHVYQEMNLSAEVPTGARAFKIIWNNRNGCLDESYTASFYMDVLSLTLAPGVRAK